MIVLKKHRVPLVFRVGYQWCLQGWVNQEKKKKKHSLAMYGLDQPDIVAFKFLLVYMKKLVDYASIKFTGEQYFYF